MTSDELRAGTADLAEVLGDVARQLNGEADLAALLPAITASSVDTIPGADYAGITLVKQGHEVESVAATDELVVQADAAQEQVSEGPCLDAIWVHDTFRIDDLEAEQRWPNYRTRALELGIRSSLSFQLFTEGRNLGALNLYSRQPHAFDDDDQQIGRLFAAHAAIALRGAQREDELQGALRSRDVIGMAKGILMERQKIDEARAFEVLVRASQTAHIKLREVAEYLVRPGSEDPAR